uniref:Uncharacterized protein n=1 Tax=Clytia hemisphaerica TaxID=252671 RepID=A0A7M5WS81_9CNID|eukprot:TCONS_00072625-protein
MVLQLRRRSLLGFWNDRCKTRERKFHGEKWSNKFFNKTFIVLVIIFYFTNCWRETQAANVVVDIEILTIPDNKNLSHLFDTCIKTASTNQTSISQYGYHTVDIINGMHFDFCNVFHPVFFISTTTLNNSNTLNLTIHYNLDNIPHKINIMVPEIFGCESIQKLYKDPTKKESGLNLYADIFNDYKQTLDRLDGCTLRKDDGKINCSDCKDSYKEWICSQYASEMMSQRFRKPVCPHLFTNVCHHCPAVEPDEGYGGYSIFQCLSDQDDSCNPSNPDCLSFNCLPTYDETRITYH